MAPRALASLLALLLGASAPAESYAQEPAALSGRVTLDGAPAADVSVFLVGTTRGAVTGDDGRYRIPGIAPGSYIVAAQRIGAAARRIELVVAAGEQATLDVAL